ncbi:MAG: spore coat associated protein CotJA [Clostridia bacterium]|nr:spore coat associated protein CotJA [Clostridia bacterium]
MFRASNDNSAGTGAEQNARVCLADVALAMVYSPEQTWNATYEPALALERGTLFPELDKPWLGEEGCADDD